MAEHFTEDSFGCAFAALTGFAPLSWQRRLYREWATDPFKPTPVIDLPTGMGKTAVMAIWLIARANKFDVPTRLIYVVDRRTVVDQATDLAQMLVQRPITKWMHDTFGGVLPAVSTLRGQLADNREWSRDPSKPAIIIGTVDLIGSALLFSGYRSSYKRRPLEAGLLGQDSLLVLDEAHLSKPFEKLICAINGDGRFQKDRERKLHGMPMKVIRMSATSGQSVAEKPPFTLQFDANGNLTGEDAKDTIIDNRFGAKKRLTIRESQDVIDSIATETGNIATSHPGSRIVIFVKSPKDVEAVRKSLIKKDKSREFKIAMLTGTMRGLERDDLVTPPTDEPQHERRVMQRFLKPDNGPSQSECFLISTSAGEVGFDLNADHLVGDAAPLDSWIQRLGRVNRRGNGDATVILIKDKDPAKTDFDKACIATSNLLTDDMNVSPNALAAFKKMLTPKQIDDASSPTPTMVELTDVLLDTWSMTSITDSMPGRPAVGPWIRGIEDEQSQTTIAWRAELELFKDASNPAKVFKAAFAKHRIRPHETITTNSSRIVDFLKGVTTAKKGQHTRPELRDTVVALKFPRNVEMTTIGKLLDDPGILNTEPTLILPPRFGGLDSSGMLSHEAIPPIPDPDDPLPLSLDVADQPGYEPLESARSRLRILIERAGDKWKPIPLPGGRPIPTDLNLDEQYATSTLLFKALAKAALRVRLVQPVAFDEEGDPMRSLVCLTPLQKKSDKIEQKLAEHVSAVECEANRIADALGLTGSLLEALRFAAKWHDEGKKADIWQRFIGRQNDSDEPLGKSAVTRDPKSLRGYRHEFGSLLCLHHTERHKTSTTLPTDTETSDLALHLIATHHGFGRPHFDNTLVKEFSTEQCETLHTNSIRRFARLQRKYGWWHLAWLENLLRCADGAASEAVTGSPDEQEDDMAEDEA
jgi:CRISPR-associated endonuclease/helicase Cas3